MRPSDQIKAKAPANAHYYQLKLPISDGHARLFPSETSGLFDVGEAPYGVPSGHYFVHYFDRERRALAHGETAIQIDWTSEHNRTPAAQMNLHLLNAQGPAVKVMPLLSVTPTSAPAPQALPPVSADPLEVELRRHMQAMDVEERQQEFIKSSTYVTELGETFALNRILRRELMEMGRMVVEASRRAFQDVEQVKGTVHDLLALQKLVLEHAATNLARPAPPPPDFVGLGHSALSVVKELGVALLARSHRAEAAALPSVATMAKAALPAGAHAMDAEISKTAAPKREEGARDGVSRIVQKLSGMSEADLATAMASVEGFRALLDSLRGGDVPTSDGARKESEANTEKVPHATSTAQAASVVEAGAAKS